jgi:hypothetical protein
MWGEAYVSGVDDGGSFIRGGRNSKSDDRRNKQSRNIEDNSREASEHFESISLCDTEQCY